MNRHRSDRMVAEVLGIYRFNIFVPAMMGVGLIFWLASELRELLHSTDAGSRDKWAQAHGYALAAMTIDGGTAPPAPLGLRRRLLYLVIATALFAGGSYVAIGSVANYLRPNGYVSGIAWLLAVASIVSFVAVAYGAAAMITFFTWPTPPNAVHRLLTHSPLTARPMSGANEPDWRWTGAAFAVATIGAVVVSLVVGASPRALDGFDARVTEWWATFGAPGWSTISGALYRTETTIAVVVVVCVAAARCRVVALTAAVTTATAVLLTTVLHRLIERPASTGGSISDVVAYPSGLVVNAVLVTLFVPLALSSLLRTARSSPLLVAVLGGAALVTAVNLVADGSHRPTAVVGGALIGLSLATAALWVLHRSWAHRWCRDCPWSSPTLVHDTAHGLIPLNVTARAVVRIVAHLWAAAAAVGLAVMTITIGIPANTEGYVFGAGVERPVQLALAGLVSVGAIAAWKWEAFGAILLALAATGLGVFASIEYQPPYAILLATAIMIPAVLLWLSWQHHRTAWELTGVAIATISLLGATWFGATTVYDSFFGPTHPASVTNSLPVDQVEWMWAGELGADGITVVARIAPDRSSATLIVEAVDGGAVVRSSLTPADDHRVVRLHVSGLEPATAYQYRVEVDGHVDSSRGVGTFRTPADGAASFRIALGACARTGSNGAVFDAISALDPLLYLALGDNHYSNISSGSIEPFLAAYDLMLTRPAQAALYRSTPIAYVWDDHDYGANDAGAESPGRRSARSAYRRSVPHYPVPPGDAAIYQAFTIGRVRFVMTDDRSERDPNTLLGEAQLDWLIEELTTSSATHSLVVWASSVPWIGDAGDDGWAAYPAERQRIADAIAASDVHNLIMVSGDAHMVAMDDGTNSDYAASGGGGFPVLHAAALDRPGSVKGGPYSEGVFPGGGQFGILDIVDDGDELAVTMQGRSWDGQVLTELQLTASDTDRALTRRP